MKNIWFLFSILILSLSVYPCGDNDECEIIAKIEISKSKNNEKHGQNAEQCPPFCSCACCGIHIYQLQNTSLVDKENLVFFNQKKQICSYSFVYNKKITLNIWQPPKIS